MDHVTTRSGTTENAKTGSGAIDANVERRAVNRMPMDDFRTSRGLVTDLSAEGMRVRCSRALKGLNVIALCDGDDEVLLLAEVQWTKRLGLLKHEIGFRFVDVAPHQIDILTRIAINNRPRRTISVELTRDAAENTEWALYAQLQGLSISLSLL